MSVNNVSAVSDALKYINGEQVAEKPATLVGDVKSSIFDPFNGIFTVGEAGSNLKAITGEASVMNAFKAINTPSVKNNILTSTNPLLQGQDAVKTFITKAEKDAAAKAAKLTSASTKTGFWATVKKPFQAISSGIGKLVSKIPGAKALSNSTFGKFMKGTGAKSIMVFQGVISLFTEVVPAFVQGGFKSGMKQLGKSSVNVAGTGLGWAGGSVVGSAIGGAIGALGGPAGVIVGQTIGKSLGGAIGMVLGGGIAKKITGKSESEIAQEKAAEQGAVQIAQDAESMNQLNALVAQKVQEDIMSGNVTDDTEKMAAYLNSGAFYANPNGVSANNPSFGTNGANVDVENPNTTAASNVTNPTTSTVSVNYWNDLAQKIQQGDTSIYDISDEKLNSAFLSPKTSNASSLNTSLDGNNLEAENSRVNYFAIG